MQAKVVEVDVRICVLGEVGCRGAAGILIHKTDEDRLADLLFQIGHDGPHGKVIVAARRKNDGPVPGPHQFRAGALQRTPGNQKTCIRMGRLERGRGKRPLARRPVRRPGTDPPDAFVPAAQGCRLLIALFPQRLDHFCDSRLARGEQVALDGFVSEGFALSRPVS